MNCERCDVPPDQHPEYHTFHVLAPPPHDDPVVQLTTQLPSVTNVCLLPDRGPQIGVLRFWANALHISSRQPVNDSFLLSMSCGGANNPSDETEGGRQLSLSFLVTKKLDWHAAVSVLFRRQPSD